MVPTKNFRHKNLSYESFTTQTSAAHTCIYYQYVHVCICIINLLQAKGQFKRRSTANNVDIIVPVPADADSPKFRVTQLIYSTSCVQCIYMYMYNHTMHIVPTGKSRFCKVPTREECSCVEHKNISCEYCSMKCIVIMNKSMLLFVCHGLVTAHANRRYSQAKGHHMNL